MQLPDAKTLSYFAGAVSAAIAALSYGVKTRHERKRATRTILYHLLELHHVAHRVAAAATLLPTELVKQIRCEMAARNQVIDEAQAHAAMREAAPFLRSIAQAHLAQGAAAAGEAFTNALADFAREDPVLAFQLRGRERMLLLPATVEAAVQGHLGSAATPGDSQAMHDALLSMGVQGVRAAIRMTAWRCGIFTHVRTSTLMRNAAKESDSGRLKELSAHLVHEFVSRREAGSAQPSPP